MADRPGHPGPTPPPYRVDGQLADQKPPEADRMPIAGLERPPEGGHPVLAYGAAQERPAFPRRPLDPACLEPSDLPIDQKAEVVRLVRLVQTDFDPKTDPTGWDSVADLVHGDGWTWDEVHQIDYPKLVAFFRNRHTRLKIQLGGTIETNTPSIVSCNAAFPSPAQAAEPARGATTPPPAGIVLGRADLTKRLQDDWATSTGKRFLLGTSVREIGRHYGVTHSTLYSNTFWNTEIKPARQTTGLRAKAVEWVDSLSRDGR